MVEPGKEFKKVGVADGAHSEADLAMRSELRSTERDLSRYFAIPSGREHVTHMVFIGKDDPIYQELIGLDKHDHDFFDKASQLPFIEVDLGEQAGLNHMIDNWIRECEKSGSESAFKSMYKILSTVEQSEHGEGALSIDQHSRILQNAAGAAVTSSMSPANKFIALSGLLKFVGPPQMQILKNIISPAMKEQMKLVPDDEFCGLIAQAYMSQYWEVSDELDVEDKVIIIDGMAVVMEETADAMEDFKFSRMGGVAKKDAVRGMLLEEFKDNPNKLLPLLKMEGNEGVRSLLLSMELRGDIPSGQVDNIPKLLQNEQKMLLGNVELPDSSL